MDSILVADLSSRDHEPASIRFQNIHFCTANTGPSLEILRLQSVPGAPYLSSQSDDSSSPNDKHGKALSKGKKAALRVAHLINGKPQSAFRLRETSDISAAEVPRLYPSNTALVCSLPRKNDTPDQEGVTSFQKMDFRLSEDSSICQRQGGFISTQYLHFSCPSLNATEVLFAANGNPVFDGVEIISGVCLFSAEILRNSLLEDGRIDPRKLLHATPTLYEMDYIARSSSAIADIASTIVGHSKALEERTQHELRLPVRITLDIPSFHYYHSIEAKLAQGSCTANEALQWIEAVEQRYDQVAIVFENSVCHELGRRGVVPPHDCEIVVSPWTKLVSSSIHQALRAGRSPSLDNILHELDVQKDGAWRDFHKLLPQKDKPHTFKALGYLFYIFQVIGPALDTRRRQYSPDCSSGSDSGSSSQPSSCFGEDSRSRRLLISIDDGAERRIYSTAQKYLKKIRNSPDSLTHPTLVEMYLCQRVFINGNESGSNLYLADPTAAGPTIIHSVNHEVDADDDLFPAPELAPMDVMRILYGSDCANNLQIWFEEVGL